MEYLRPRYQKLEVTKVELIVTLRHIYNMEGNLSPRVFFTFISQSYNFGEIERL